MNNILMFYYLWYHPLLPWLYKASHQMQFSPTCIALHGLCSNSLEYTYVVGAALWRSVNARKCQCTYVEFFLLYTYLSFQVTWMLFSSSSPNYNFYVIRKIFCAALKHENLFSLGFFLFQTDRMKYRMLR